VRDKRADVIAQILDRWCELTERAGSSGVKGDDGTVALMPKTYTPSVREVERLMVRLREERHSVWWHVNERFLKAHTRTLFRCPKCKGETHAAQHRHRDKHGKHSNYEGARVLRTTWSPRVDARKVDAGLQWMAGEWSLAHEPMLPSELLVAA